MRPKVSLKLPHRVEERLNLCDRPGIAGDDDIQLRLRGRGRDAENRCRDVSDPCGAVQRDQFIDERRRDRRHHHVDAILPRRSECARVDDHAAHGVVVGQHGQDGVVPERVSWRREDRDAFERRGRGCIAVPDLHAMTCLDEVGHHGGAHAADSDKSDVHRKHLRLCC